MDDDVGCLFLELLSVAQGNAKAVVQKDLIPIDNNDKLAAPSR
jgi:hypothetical protein